MNSNSPDVAELIERIRHERAVQRKTAPSAPEARLDLPDPVNSLPPPPVVPQSDKEGGIPAWTALAELVKRAKDKITVKASIPAWLRPLARNQGGYNGILLETVERLGEGNRQLQEEIDGLRASLRAQSAWLGDLMHARDAERAWMRKVEPYLMRGLLESDLHRLRADKAESRLEHLEQQHHHARNELDQVGIRVSHVEARGASLEERLSELKSQSDEHAGRFHALDRNGNRPGHLPEKPAEQ